MHKIIAAVLLGSLAAVAQAQAPQPQKKYCYDANGERYVTYRAECPSGQNEVKPKIVSCTLPDGTRTFGDKCPNPQAKAQQLDQEGLAKRTQGASSVENDQKMLRFSQKERFEAENARRQRENDEARARYELERKQYEVERKKAQEAARKRQEEKR